MRRYVATVGRILITLGLLILLFVGYQLWGTGVFEARAQEDLRDEFAARLREQVTTTTSAPGPTTPAPTTTTLPPNPTPVPGEPVGFVNIPKIGVNKVVVEGTEVADLKKGPGHYPATPLPGQLGNASIAGHRTTYGAPFFDLDQLVPGDEIVATTLVGKYTYVVRWTHVVQPTDTWVAGPVDGWQGAPPDVMADASEAWLTLTTCNPKYSARERYIVHAQLKVEASPPPVAPPSTVAPKRPQPVTLAEGLHGEDRSLGPAYGWGAVAAGVGLVWWWFFRRWRHPVTWLVGVGPFLAVLFVFYVYLERVLPTSY